MTRLDHFESAFRATERERLAYERLRFSNILVVTDFDGDEADAFGAEVRAFLSVLETDEPSWRIVRADEYDSVQDLLDLTDAAKPDLVCTYRNLKTQAWRSPYTLGDHLEVLTQVAPMPVLVMPHPSAGRAAEHATRNTDAVTVITDHLTGEDRLVNTAARFTAPAGRLWLTHVEDQAAFERFIDVISRIPSIDTDDARDRIQERLLKEPRDFIASCAEVLASAGLSIRVEEMVAMGRHLREYTNLVQRHEVDLLVFNAKDDDQLAMHGLAYPLAIEIRHIPLLML